MVKSQKLLIFVLYDIWCTIYDYKVNNLIKNVSIVQVIFPCGCHVRKTSVERVIGNRHTFINHRVSCWWKVSSLRTDILPNGCFHTRYKSIRCDTSASREIQASLAWLEFCWIAWSWTRWISIDTLLANVPSIRLNRANEDWSYRPLYTSRPRTW